MGDWRYRLQTTSRCTSRFNRELIINIVPLAACRVWLVRRTTRRLPIRLMAAAVAVPPTVEDLWLVDLRLLWNPKALTQRELLHPFKKKRWMRSLICLSSLWIMLPTQNSLVSILSTIVAWLVKCVLKDIFQFFSHKWLSKANHFDWRFPPPSCDRRYCWLGHVARKTYAKHKYPSRSLIYLIYPLSALCPARPLLFTRSCWFSSQHRAQECVPIAVWRSWVKAPVARPWTVCST